MSHYPGSEWRPVAYTGLHARQRKRAAILHTNGGGAQLYDWWSKIAASGSHVGSHYQVFIDGTSECYVDPSKVIYHAYGASEWAFAIETEDDSNNRRPWTAAQIYTIAEILFFHGVPATMLTGIDAGNGVGYHQQHSAWNGSGHDCPGPVRTSQIPLVLAVLNHLYHPNPTEDDVSPEQDARLKNIEKMFIDLIAPRPADHHDVDTQHISLADVLTVVENQGKTPSA